MRRPVVRPMLASFTLVTLAAVAAAGCGAGDPPSRSGADVEPVTLTATSYEQQGRIGAETLAEFGRRASALSNGAIKIELGPDPDNSRPDTSAEKIAEIRKGTYDLGIVAARSFDRLGVPAFQALQAPFLVTSNELGDRILADGIADEMLGKLDAVALEGLALTYADRRFPIGYGAPLISPHDYRAGSVAARPSATTYAMLRALGAIPTSINGGQLVAAAEAATVIGSEGVLSRNSPISPATITANTPWYFKANALVVNRSVFEGLSRAQQRALRAAAVETRDWAAAQHIDDATEASQYCTDGNGAVVLATEEQLTELRSAVAPLYETMERDPLSKKAIARIRELAGDTSAPNLSQCSPPEPTGPAAGGAAKGDQTVLDGTWRLSIKAQDLEAAGTTPEYAGGNAGVWTFHLQGGEGTIDQPLGDPCLVAYTINGKRIVFDFAARPGSGCGGKLHGAFELSGDKGSFHWTKQDECCDPVAWDNAFWAGGLHRVGPAPETDQSVLDGAWRLTVDEANLVAANVKPDFLANVGILTFNLRGGLGVFETSGDRCTVAYVIRGSSIRWDFCGQTLVGTFEMENSVASFNWTIDEDSDDPVAWDNAVWKNGLHRIGDAPTTVDTALDGSWRLLADAKRLRQVGASPAFVRDHSGTFTLRLNAGQGKVDRPDGKPCIVSYATGQGRIVMNFHADPRSSCQGVLHGTYEVKGEVASIHWLADEGLTPVLWNDAFFADGLRHSGDTP